ncbi:hypothetical protein B5S43_06175 [Gilliamella apicola]|uniref:hypothetical protein n=1 Tax=Gilliamella apicola TaxID=1196095 RepID=UPI000A346DF2|nr:hypothetical protein [Gilliamella apicola]OTQ03826.1 hypothetical protein B5S43_06175 [Gilliamella apicola]OTQ24899.1 hypothetical protein B6D22_02925 [Gilliamella apicola]
MHNINYIEAKKLTIESYHEFIDEGFSVEQAIPAVFEDLVISMKKNNKILVAIIQNLSIISLKHNFIPDYLLNRLSDLKINTELNNNEILEYTKDKEELNVLLKNKYTLDEDENYSKRVDILLGT